MPLKKIHNDLQVVLGEHDTSDSTESILERKEIAVKQAIIHEEYNQTSSDNDIAVLELAEEVDLAVYTPACMAKTTDDTTFDDKKAWAYGEIKMRPL